MARRAISSNGGSGSLDLGLIRQAAATRWPEILSSLASVPREALDGRHGPCPKCGGVDRFRMIDAAAGALLCGQCFREKNGDGFAALQWLLSCDFRTAAGKIADYLGIDAASSSGQGKGGSGSNGKPHADPAEHLTFQPWHEGLAALWCLAKPPITPAGILAARGQLAAYRGQWQALSLPVVASVAGDAPAVGFTLYNRTGGTLPIGGDKYAKVKSTKGSGPGLLGQVAALADPATETVWWVEGCTDLLALLSEFAASPKLSTGHAVIANPFGAGEKIQQWVLDALQGKSVNVIGDRDKTADGKEPGPEGAARRAAALAAAGITARNVTLPYPLVAGQKRDLRDYFTEGHSLASLLALASSTPTVTPEQAAESIAAARKVNEADDDPHRLARINLQQYAAENNGRTLRYWRDEWYVWKSTHYRKISDRDLRSKLAQVCKEEFDRLNLEALERYEQVARCGQLAEDDKGPPLAKKVSINLVSNVMQATAGLTNLSSSIDPMTWIPTRERKSYIAMQNGILDVDAAIEDRDDYLLPHTADWFSTVCLPYDFNADATCPKWNAFLEKNLEGDQERIAVLQEWAGYLLLPDTGYQRFLVLEGEGANGKSVYCAAIEAMLGAANVAHVPLEVFGEKFELTATLDRLANVCGDAGELDKVAEGHIKAFTAGNPMSFGRKYLDAVERVPTARLMMAVNNRPRFSDRSDGVWRRMLLVPWLIQIGPGDRVPNMDKPWWWEKQGELPGILLWAIEGLERLRRNSQFTHSKLCEEALDDYRAEMNPARKFLAEHLVRCETAKIQAQQLYDHYVAWTTKHGNRPLADTQLGKEVARVFRIGKKERPTIDGKRVWVYPGIAYQEEKGPDVIDGDQKRLGNY
jgi:P4 family phage/plasmid primase-like protien